MILKVNFFCICFFSYFYFTSSYISPFSSISSITSYSSISTYSSISSIPTFSSSKFFLSALKRKNIEEKKEKQNTEKEYYKYLIKSLLEKRFDDENIEEEKIDLDNEEENENKIEDTIKNNHKRRKRLNNLIYEKLDEKNSLSLLKFFLKERNLKTRGEKFELFLRSLLYLYDPLSKNIEVYPDNVRSLSFISEDDLKTGNVRRLSTEEKEEKKRDLNFYKSEDLQALNSLLRKNKKKEKDELGKNHNNEIKKDTDHFIPVTQDEIYLDGYYGKSIFNVDNQESYVLDNLERSIIEFPREFYIEKVDLRKQYDNFIAYHVTPRSIETNGIIFLLAQNYSSPSIRKFSDILSSQLHTTVIVPKLSSDKKEEALEAVICLLKNLQEEQNGKKIDFALFSTQNMNHLNLFISNYFLFLSSNLAMKKLRKIINKEQKKFFEEINLDDILKNKEAVTFLKNLRMIPYQKNNLTLSPSISSSTSPSLNLFILEDFDPFHDFSPEVFEERLLQSSLSIERDIERKIGSSLMDLLNYLNQEKDEGKIAELLRMNNFNSSLDSSQFDSFNYTNSTFSMFSPFEDELEEKNEVEESFLIKKFEKIKKFSNHFNNNYFDLDFNSLCPSYSVYLNPSKNFTEQNSSLFLPSFFLLQEEENDKRSISSLVQQLNSSSVHDFQVMTSSLAFNSQNFIEKFSQEEKKNIIKFLLSFHMNYGLTYEEDNLFSLYPSSFYFKEQEPLVLSSSFEKNKKLDIDEEENESYLKKEEALIINNRKEKEKSKIFYMSKLFTSSKQKDFGLNLSIHDQNFLR